MADSPWDDAIGRKIYEAFDLSSHSTSWQTITTLSGSTHLAPSQVKDYIREHPSYFTHSPIQPGGVVLYGPAKVYYKHIEPEIRWVTARGTEWSVKYRSPQIAIGGGGSIIMNAPLPPGGLVFKSPGYSFFVETADQPTAHSDEELAKMVLEHFAQLETGSGGVVGG